MLSKAHPSLTPARTSISHFVIPAMQQSSALANTTSSQSHQEQQLREQVELLKNDNSNSPATSAYAIAQSIAQAENYHHPSASSADGSSLAGPSTSPYPGARSLAAKPRPESLIHPELRAQAQGISANMMPIAPPSAHSPVTGHANPIIAPAPPTGSSPEESPSDGRKAKRELSQSKRAAQNRAAQRAFRQRKEYYIKKLEQQVREYMDMEQSFKTMQSENYALREYVIHLQSRLLDAQGEYPQPPPNINLSQPSSNAPGLPQQSQQSQPQQPQPPQASSQVQIHHHHHPSPPHHPSGPSAQGSTATAGSGTPLEAVAQAVVGLTAQEQMHDRAAEGRYSGAYEEKRDSSNEDTRSAEEINRHLQSAEAPSHE